MKYAKATITVAISIIAIITVTTDKMAAILGAIPAPIKAPLIATILTPKKTRKSGKDTDTDTFQYFYRWGQSSSD